MMSADDSTRWLERRMEEYRSGKSDIREVIDDLADEGKLGREFSSIDELKEIDIGDGGAKRPTYVNANLPQNRRKRYINCSKNSGPVLHGNTPRCLG
jgi:hypothetical protein